MGADRPVVYFANIADTETSGATDFSGARPVGFISHPNNILAYDMNRPAGTSYYHKPRGSWKIQKIYSLSAAGAERAPTLTGTEVYVKFEVTEPLLLSPFVFGSGFGKQWFLRDSGYELPDGLDRERKSGLAVRSLFRHQDGFCS